MMRMLLVVASIALLDIRVGEGAQCVDIAWAQDLTPIQLSRYLDDCNEFPGSRTIGDWRINGPSGGSGLIVILNLTSLYDGSEDPWPMLFLLCGKSEVSSEVILILPNEFLRAGGVDFDAEDPLTVGLGGDRHTGKHGYKMGPGQSLVGFLRDIKGDSLLYRLGDELAMDVDVTSAWGDQIRWKYSLYGLGGVRAFVRERYGCHL